MASTALMESRSGAKPAGLGVVSHQLQAKLGGGGIVEAALEPDARIVWAGARIDVNTRRLGRCFDGSWRRPGFCLGSTNADR